MKRILIFFALLAFQYCKAQQVPWNGIEVGNLNNVNGTFFAPYDLYAPIITPGPVVVSGNSHVDFIAGDRVHLHPGFSANNITGNGYFHAQIGAAPDFDVVFIEPDEHIPNVGQFEKLEMGIQLPAATQTHVDNFLNSVFDPLSINPYDPDRINIEAVFTNGTTSLKQYGFFYKDYHRDLTDLYGQAVWIPDTTNYQWRIRFAAPIQGRWNVDIKIFLYGNGIPAFSVNNITFNCLSSSNQGFLEIGQDNRHLRFSGTHNSFFALGQNIAWPERQSWRGGRPLANFQQVYESGLLDVYDYIQNLADNGGNFVRIIATAQAFEIEWGNQPGVYRMEQAWELDYLFELCHEKGIYVLFNPDFQGKYRVDGGASGWNNNPYNSFPSVSTPEDLFSTGIFPTTEKYFEQRMRYIFARWGYSTNLGIFQFFSEQENWDGFRDGVMEQNASKQLEMYNLQSDLADYLQGWYFGAIHLLSSSYAQLPYLYDDFNTFDISTIDITAVNDYGRSKGISKEYYDDFYNGNTSSHGGNFTLWDKPAVHAEMGLFQAGVDNEGHPLADAGDITFCNDVEFHNAIWSTSFFGTIGCGLNWWQWDNNGFRTQNFPAIRSFFNAQDFEGLTWNNAGHWADFSFTLFNYYRHVKIETFYIATQSNDHVMGWVHNATNYWGNIVQNSCTDRYSNTMPLPPDDDHQWNIPQTIGGTDIGRVEAMNFGSYTVQRYNTRGSGGFLGSSYTIHTDLFGRLQINWFAQVPDFAFRADFNSLFGRLSGDTGVVTENNPDTLAICLHDTIIAKGTFLFDTGGSNIYKWYLDNELYSESAHPEFYFNGLGLHSIRVDVSDSAGLIASFQQQANVVDCGEDENSRIGKLFLDTAINTIIIYPNPVEDVVYIHLPDGQSGTQIVKIFTMSGELVLTTSLVGKNESELDVSELLAGIYVLEIASFDKKYFFKLIKIH
jgi:hypothetical protein